MLSCSIVLKLIQKLKRQKFFSMLTISLYCIKRTLTNFLTFTIIFTKSLIFSNGSAAACVNFIKGEAIQGGLIFYDSSYATEINLDGEPIIVNKENGFVVGFHRDDLAMRTIEGLCKDGSPFSLKIQPSL